MEYSIVEYERPKTEIKPFRNNYSVTIGTNNFVLERDSDFGMIVMPNGRNITKKPTLFKSGAHKILTAFGLTYQSEIIDAYKDHEKGYFYYEVKTTAYFNGEPVRTGFGCANTNESGNGSASAYNVANSMLKKAVKRSEVDIAIKLADASSWFNQDLEDESNEEKAKQVLTDEDAITPKQSKRIFAIAAENEITAEKAKNIIASLGFASTKDIKQKDYDNVVEHFKKYNNNLEEAK